MESTHPLRIIDCSVKMEPGTDSIADYTKEHIKGTRFLDLKLVRDLSSAFPFMMPSKEYFIMIAKALDIRLTHTVIIYDT